MSVAEFATGVLDEYAVLIVNHASVPDGAGSFVFVKALEAIKLPSYSPEALIVYPDTVDPPPNPE